MDINPHDILKYYFTEGESNLYFIGTFDVGVTV